MKKTGSQSKIEYPTVTGETRLINPLEPAYHAAGLVVVGWVLGWEPTVVSIESAFPQCKFKTKKPCSAVSSSAHTSVRKTHAKNKLTWAQAGVEALKKRRPNGSWLTYWLNYGRNAVGPMVAPGHRLLPHDETNFWEKQFAAERDARKLVHTHWGEIKGLAKALVKRNTLRGEEIFKAMGDFLPVKYAGCSHQLRVKAQSAWTNRMHRKTK